LPTFSVCATKSTKTTKRRSIIRFAPPSFHPPARWRKSSRATIGRQTICSRSWKRHWI